MNYPKTLVNSLSKIDTEIVRPKNLIVRSNSEEPSARWTLLLSRSASSVRQPLHVYCEQFKKWEFNVYDVADASKQRPLTYVLYELLKKYDLLTTFKVSIVLGLVISSCCWWHSDVGAIIAVAHFVWLLWLHFVNISIVTHIRHQHRCYWSYF